MIALKEKAPKGTFDKDNLESSADGEGRPNTNAEIKKDDTGIVAETLKKEAAKEHAIKVGTVSNGTIALSTIGAGVGLAAAGWGLAVWMKKKPLWFIVGGGAIGLVGGFAVPKYVVPYFAKK